MKINKLPTLEARVEALEQRLVAQDALTRHLMDSVITNAQWAEQHKLSNWKEEMEAMLVKPVQPEQTAPEDDFAVHLTLTAQMVLTTRDLIELYNLGVREMALTDEALAAFREGALTATIAGDTPPTDPRDAGQLCGIKLWKARESAGGQS